MKNEQKNMNIARPGNKEARRSLIRKKLLVINIDKEVDGYKLHISMIVKALICPKLSIS